MTENVNTYHRNPKKGEIYEYVAKPGTEHEHEHDDDKLSQPSTLHSLSHLDATPEKTPVSTDLKKEWSNLSGDFKQKASEFKGKLTEKFGDQPQPEKDLDSESKEHVKEINEEIKHMPHGEEEIVEGQGHGQERSSDKFGGMKDKLGSQMQGLKDTASRKFEQAKGKLIEKVGEQPQPEKDLDSDAKEHVKEINEEIKHMPHGEEEIVEGQGQAGSGKQNLKEKAQQLGDKASDKFGELKGKAGQQGERLIPSDSGSQDFRQMSQGIVDKALGKIDEVKGKASQQSEKLKEGAREASQKIEQARPELSSESKVEVQEGSQPLTKDSKEEILELAQQITDKIQELKTAGVLPSEQQKSQGSEQQKSQGPSSQEESHEHHQLSTESQSFKPTQESHELIEKVEEGLAEGVPLTEVVEEIDHSKQPESGDRQPIVDKVQQGVQKLSDKFSGKAEEIKSKLSVPKQGESSGSQEESQSFSRPPGLETFQPQGSGFGYEQREGGYIDESRRQPGSETFQKGGQPQPAFEKLQQGAQKLGDKFSGKAEELKSKLSAPKVEELKSKLSAPKQEEKSEFKQEGSQQESKPQRFELPVQEGEVVHKRHFEEEFEKREQPEEKSEERQPAIEKIQQGIQSVKEKLSAPKQEEKSEIKQESKPEVQEKEVDIKAQPEEKESGKGSIKQNIQEASNKISDKVQDVKDSINERREKKSEDQEGQEEGEQEKPKERQPLVDQILGRIHAVNDNFHQKVDSVRDAFKIEERTDERQPIVDVVSGKIQSVSNTISSLKEKVRPSHKEKEVEIPQKEEKSTEKSGPTLRQKVTDSYQNLSYKLSENLDNVKERFMSKEGEQGRETKKFHKVDENEGFGKETVKDYQDEKRMAELGGHELISENPYEPLYENKEEKQGYFDKIKGKFRKEKDEDELDESEKIQDLDEIPEQAKEEGKSLKQRFNKGIENLKGKWQEELDKSELIGKGKESEEKSAEPLKEAAGKKAKKAKKEIEEKSEESKPLEKSGDFNQIKKDVKEDIAALKTLKNDFPEASAEFPEQHESQTLKQKISGGLESISGKISQNVDSLKGKFRKEKAPEEQPESLDEPEEALPEEESQPEAEKQSLKQKLAGGFEGLKGRFAKKGEEKEGEQPKEGEFHVVTDGITESVGELKEEERVAPLLSNNPFEPLETKDTNIVQPLEGSDLVGGDLKQLTADEKPAFKVEESSGNEEKEGSGESKSLFQKMKAGLASTFSRNKENAE